MMRSILRSLSTWTSESSTSLWEAATVSVRYCLPCFFSMRGNPMSTLRGVGRLGVPREDRQKGRPGPEL